MRRVCIGTLVRYEQTVRLSCIGNSSKALTGGRHCLWGEDIDHDCLLIVYRGPDGREQLPGGDETGRPPAFSVLHRSRRGFEGWPVIIWLLDHSVPVHIIRASSSSSSSSSSSFFSSSSSSSSLLLMFRLLLIILPLPTRVASSSTRILNPRFFRIT